MVGAFSFDGVDDGVVVSAAVGLDVGAGEGLTVEGWIRPAGVATMQPVAEWNDGVGGIGAHLWLGVEANLPGGGAGSLYANLVDNAGQSHQIASPAGLLEAGVYQHVALTYERGSGWGRLYRNGRVVAQANLGSMVPATTGDLYFGVRPSGEFAGAHYAGQMDEVSLYNRALGEAEVAGIYEAGGGGKCHTAQGPSITVGPEGQRVVAGGRARFGVVAAGTPPLSYQWFWNGSEVEGATGAELVLEGVQASQAGAYLVVVSSPYGEVRSEEALLVVEAGPVGPVIVGQPQSQSVALGGSVSFGVEVSGTSPFSYQWRLNGQDVVGGTGPVLSLVNVGAGQAGEYRVEVSNAGGSVVSEVAVLTVEADGVAPYVTSTSLGRRVFAGEDVVLTVEAEGSEPLSYQWYWNGGLLAGATESMLELSDIQESQAGTYTVVVSNPYGSVTTLGAVLTVDLDFSGGSVVFANRTANRVYDVDGLTPLPVGATFLAQLYGGPVGAALEPVGGAVRFIALPGIFGGQPRYIRTVPAGGRASVQVKVWESAYGRSYEEALANGGRTGASSIIEMTTGGGMLPPPSMAFVLESFSLVGGVGTAGPEITAEPQDGAVLLGQDAQFGVGVRGPGPMEYQWYFNGAVLGGATGGTLGLSGVGVGSAGEYWVVVRNAGGAVTSAVATLTVEVRRVLAVVSPPEQGEGDLVRVPVELESMGDVGGMTFVLRYNPDYLTGPEVEWGEALAGALKQAHVPVLGQVRLVFAQAGAGVAAGRQELARVSFRARTVPVEAETGLELELVDVADPGGELIEYGTALESGSVRIVGGGGTGDNNGNGVLDVGDATLLLRMLAELDTVRSWDIGRNDLNGNGVLDVGDAIKVLLAVAEEPMGLGLGGEAGGLGMGGAVGDGETAYLSPGRLRGTNGQWVTVEVRLENVPSRVAGASVTVDYPVEALRLVGAAWQRVGWMVPGDALAAWHVAGGYENQLGQVRLAVSSASAWALNEGVLAELTFAVQPGAGERYLWTVGLSEVEVTADGYGPRLVASSGMELEGREPVAGVLGVTGWNGQGAFEVRIEGDEGAAYVVEASEDLQSWVTLTTAVQKGSVLIVTDPDAASFSQRFYRTRPAQ